MKYEHSRREIADELEELSDEAMRFDPINASPRTAQNFLDELAMKIESLSLRVLDKKDPLQVKAERLQKIVGVPVSVACGSNGEVFRVHGLTIGQIQELVPGLVFEGLGVERRDLPRVRRKKAG